MSFIFWFHVIAFAVSMFSKIGFQSSILVLEWTVAKQILSINGEILKTWNIYWYKILILLRKLYILLWKLCNINNFILQSNLFYPSWYHEFDL